VLSRVHVSICAGRGWMRALGGLYMTQFITCALGIALFQECLESDDREGALATLKALMEKCESHESPPDCE